MGHLLALLVAALPEVNLSLLRPASGSDGLLGVEGARPPTDSSEPLQLQVGLDFGYKPIRMGLDGVSHESRSGGWVQLAAPLNGYASIFAQLPITLGQLGSVAHLSSEQHSSPLRWMLIRMHRLPGEAPEMTALNGPATPNCGTLGK